MSSDARPDEPDPIADAKQAYAALAAANLAEPDVALGRALGNEVLTVRGRIFAFRKDDRLVVKLPASRAAELVAAGVAVPFQTGRSPMREWVAAAPPTTAGAAGWAELAAQARAFVAALPAKPARSGRSARRRKA